MKINEIFYSLQGEGFYSGTPSVFVRFALCNLKCEFCDTQFNEYSEMSIEQIISEINQYPCDRIILTGGEPSLQITQEFINRLKKENKYVCIETNGTNPLPNNIDWVTLSPKLGSKIALKTADEVKVVFINQNVEKYFSEIAAKEYFLQPCSMKNTQEVVEYILKNPHWKLSLQTHKYLDIR